MYSKCREKNKSLTYFGNSSEKNVFISKKGSSFWQNGRLVSKYIKNNRSKRKNSDKSDVYKLDCGTYSKLYIG